MHIETAMPSKQRKKASAGGSLPDEMLMEVLLRLPMKSILRAVCRSWAALFSIDEFCRLYMATPRAMPPKLLFVSPTARSGSTEVHSCSPSDSKDDDQLFAIHSACGNSMQLVMPAPCHGLSLLFDAVAPAYYICNAATRAVTRLPPFPHVIKDTSTGFGYDARTGKYKVVRLMNGWPHDEKKVSCEVYTHEGGNGGSWRPPARGIRFGLCRFVRNAVSNGSFDDVPPVFLNRFLHWLVRPSFFSKRRTRAGIVSFSLAEETFTSAGPPPFWKTEPYPRVPFWESIGAPPPFLIGALGEHLMEMDDQLCLVRDLRYNPLGGCTLEIWKLMDYSSGAWSLNHRINFFGRVARELRQKQVVRVVGYTGSGKSRRKIIIATSEHRIYDKYLKKFYTYDLSSQSLKSILSLIETHASLEGRTIPRSRSSLFQESLAPVHKTYDDIALSATPPPS